MDSNETTSAHTPGPWRADWFGDDRGWIRDEKGNYLAENVTEDDCGFVAPKDEQQANARLIAAAPELLEHLETILEMAHSVSANWENGDLAFAVRSLERIACAAEVAVTKARGESTC